MFKPYETSIRTECVDSTCIMHFPCLKIRKRKINPEKWIRMCKITNQNPFASRTWIFQWPKITIIVFYVYLNYLEKEKKWKKIRPTSKIIMYSTAVLSHLHFFSRMNDSALEPKYYKMNEPNITKHQNCRD